MRAIGFKSHVSLDAWLFGEDRESTATGTPTATATNNTSASTTDSQSQSQSKGSSWSEVTSTSSRSATFDATSSSTSSSSTSTSAFSRSRSVPSINHITETKRNQSVESRSAPVAPAPTSSQASVSGPPLAKTRVKKLSLVTPPKILTSSNPSRSGSFAFSSTTGSSDPSEPFPMSKRLRKLFRPNRLQWNKTRRSPANQAGSSTSSSASLSSGIGGTRSPSSLSYQKLQGHVPFSLKEIVKDPKKLPYLLRWLSSDSEVAFSSKTNYHQVLLFLLEIEQLQLVTEDKCKEQALKIYNKYIDDNSEFEISSTLELTAELEQLVRDNIESPQKVLDSFYPVQKLAYMRLTREEMPRFVKSDEYLQMLSETENDLEAVPMEKILDQPRAAHYFLLFLMQSRQHFELYFWLHVEYVLKPLLEEQKYGIFWSLAQILEQKARNDSQAVTLSTKKDLRESIRLRTFDDKSQPVAKTLFAKAQQEIFVMLRSSWYNRFMKSNLYGMALKDSQICLSRKESKDDSPPKPVTRTFSALNSFSEESGDEDERESDQDVVDDSFLLQDAGNDGSAATSPISIAASSTLPKEDSDGDNSDSSETDFGKMLDLESIIRVTKLPDGLQVHYRPHYDAPVAHHDGESTFIDTIVIFETTIEADQPNLVIKRVDEEGSTKTERSNEVCRRIRPFLVPDGKLVISTDAMDAPPDILFFFQQSGRDGFLYGCVFLTYSVDSLAKRAHGICLLSHLPVVDHLRQALESHLNDHDDTSDCMKRLFDHDRLLHLKTLKHHQDQSQELIMTSPVAPPISAVETHIDVSLEPFFRAFGPSLALQIIASALLECSVVLVSSQFSQLTYCAEAIRSLLRPFAWCHVYAPVLPKQLLSYLQCPTPILVGVHSSYVSRSDLPSSGFTLVADIERCVVEYTGTQSVAWRNLGLRDDRRESDERIFIPCAFEATKRAIDMLLTPERLNLDRIGGIRSLSKQEQQHSFPNQQIQKLCFELFSSLLEDHTSACLVVGDTKESVVIFDETQFLSCQKLEDHAFFKTLMRAQCFSEIISAHRIETITAKEEP